LAYYHLQEQENFTSMPRVVTDGSYARRQQLGKFPKFNRVCAHIDSRMKSQTFWNNASNHHHSGILVAQYVAVNGNGTGELVSYKTNLQLRIIISFPKTCIPEFKL